MSGRGITLLAGAIFGAGLSLSGMIQPARVLGFLDFTGAWDPTLALVMFGAVTVHFVATRFVLRRGAPLMEERFHLPTRKDADPRLLFGSAIFGVGWGLAGYCPGPGLTAAAAGSFSAIVFVGAMLAGMVLEHATTGKKSPIWRADHADPTVVR
jgi:uncharacterized membrane protein YedE/YeeE